MPIDPQSGVHYELHGQGRPLMICLPLMASQAEIFGPESLDMLRGYLSQLTDRYRVLLLDYPSIGRSRDISPGDLTADRVSADLLSVADSAGLSRFSYWGYSWGGAVGLQLASRTDRLDALVIGGWPPLGAPYAAILRATLAKMANPEPGSLVVLRSPAQYAQWSHYYASMQGWDEAKAVAGLRLPRLVYVGAEGDLVEAGESIPIASLVRQHRGELEAQGWRVMELPGQGHAVAMRPELVVPPVRSFLDAARPGPG
jgi:pimeloyl-ACP methyl ester carboxylesterase